MIRPRQRHRSLAMLALAALAAASLAAITATPAAGATATPPAGAIPDRIVVQYAPGTPASDRVDAEAAVGARLVGAIEQLDVRVLSVPADRSAGALAGLRRNPNVRSAEHDVVVAVSDRVPDDTYWGYQWSPRHTGAPAAWDVTTGSPSVTIAVLDTGVSAVSDLQGNLVTGRNVLDGSTNTVDNHGHGTRSASVAGAVSNNAAGVAGYCWSCRLLPVKIMETSTGTVSDLAKGIVAATDAGAHVISMSVSAASGTSALASAVRYASDRDRVLVAAAGNDGTTTARYPAAYSEVIGVAGTDSADRLYSWSNHGGWVDVAAPGVNYTASRTGGYGTFSGTSSATPVVAGIAGLALSLPSGPTGTQVRHAIATSAVSIGKVVKHGRVDVAATIAALGGAPAATPPAVAISSPGSGATVSGSFDVTGTAAAGSGSTIESVEVRLGKGDWVPATGSAAWSTTLDTTGLADGSHELVARVTDTAGRTADASITVTVTSPPEPEPEPVPSAPALTVTASKVKGFNHAVLSWEAAVGSPATVHRSGSPVATVASGTGYTDDTGSKGGGTATYQVCGPAGCTPAVTVTW